MACHLQRGVELMILIPRPIAGLAGLGWHAQRDAGLADAWV
jgi:hypothetical protein